MFETIKNTRNRLNRIFDYVPKYRSVEVFVQNVKGFGMTQYSLGVINGIILIEQLSGITKENYVEKGLEAALASAFVGTMGYMLNRKIVAHAKTGYKQNESKN